jgi:hypothetical protein
VKYDIGISNASIIRLYNSFTSIFITFKLYLEFSLLMKLKLVSAKLVERGVDQAVFLNNLPKFQGF